MRLRTFVLAALVGTGVLLGSSTQANAGLFNRNKSGNSSCTSYCYSYCYTPCYYCYPGHTYKIYKVWHVYKTNPTTGAPELVKRYLTKETADADADVVGKKAYVQEVSYYAP